MGLGLVLFFVDGITMAALSAVHVMRSASSSDRAWIESSFIASTSMIQMSVRGPSPLVLNHVPAMCLPSG